MNPLDAIREASHDLDTDEELRAAVALIRRRAGQINMMADHRSIAENRFEVGDEVTLGPGGPVYKVVAVHTRSVVVTLGMRSRKIGSGKGKDPDDATRALPARHVQLADRVIRESRDAYHKLGDE